MGCSASTVKNPVVVEAAVVGRAILLDREIILDHARSMQQRLQNHENALKDEMMIALDPKNVHTFVCTTLNTVEMTVPEWFHKWEKRNSAVWGDNHIDPSLHFEDEEETEETLEEANFLVKQFICVRQQLLSETLLNMCSSSQLPHMGMWEVKVCWVKSKTRFVREIRKIVTRPARRV